MKYIVSSIFGWICFPFLSGKTQGKNEKKKVRRKKMTRWLYVAHTYKSNQEGKFFSWFETHTYTMEISKT